MTSNKISTYEHIPILQDLWITIDLETTGLSFNNDEIIEIGAIKFKGRQIVDKFQTFVNPHKHLNDFIKRFTGITQAQVNEAPSFADIAEDLISFLGSSPIIGHNISFDLGFLNRKGLKLTNPICDTWDMAYVLFPELKNYSLSKLSQFLDSPHTRPHRAVEDAMATMEVFLTLTEKFSEFDIHTISEMQSISNRSTWVLSYLLRRLESDKIIKNTSSSSQNQSHPSINRLGIPALDIEDINKRIRRPKSLRPNHHILPLDVNLVDSLLKKTSSLSQTISGFEERPQQLHMARAISDSLNRNQHLIAEAGTGVGKSMAYLLPAILYASMNNKRVVVSTKTINLQDQLFNKDVPTLLESLNGTQGISVKDTKFTQLKGRSNYVCLKRWAHMRSSESLTDNEARILSKILVWLKTTDTGDRSELSLGNRKAAAPWDRLSSAQGFQECLNNSEPCFLRAARENAAASHLVIVNHALLLSDMVAGGSLIPEHDILIIDEAQHLEYEATRHLGFTLAQSRIEDHFRTQDEAHGLFRNVATSVRNSSAAITRRTTIEKSIAEASAFIPRARENLSQLYIMLSGIFRDLSEGNYERGQDFRVTSSTRKQPGWSQLEIQWENSDVALSELGRYLNNLHTAFEALEESQLFNYEGLKIELNETLQVNTEIRQRLAEFITQPKEDGIYWLTRTLHNNDITMHSAPLHVGDTLDKLLFSNKETVVMTGATLSSNGTFEYIRERTGLTQADEILLGSPFNYPEAALLCVPKDMPDPNSLSYQTALEDTIIEMVLASKGHAMALFTSHYSLKTTAHAIRENLNSHGIDLLAQGIDGTPAQLLKRFLENPTSILMGTSSFWEGVDLSGDSLQLLILTRLPFSVPTEPIFATRAEQYENPFNEYAIPQAILRLRQGFGRLIRTKTDRGVVVLLDQRVVTKRYGQALIDSLPPVKYEISSLANLPIQIKQWIDA